MHKTKTMLLKSLKLDKYMKSYLTGNEVQKKDCYQKFEMIWGEF